MILLWNLDGCKGFGLENRLFGEEEMILAFDEVSCILEIELGLEIGDVLERCSMISWTVGLCRLTGYSYLI
jgi:hypothetical protein